MNDKLLESLRKDKDLFESIAAKKNDVKEGSVPETRDVDDRGVNMNAESEQKFTIRLFDGTEVHYFDVVAKNRHEARIKAEQQYNQMVAARPKAATAPANKSNVDVDTLATDVRDLKKDSDFKKVIKFVIKNVPDTSEYHSMSLNDEWTDEAVELALADLYKHSKDAFNKLNSAVQKMPKEDNDESFY